MTKEKKKEFLKLIEKSKKHKYSPFRPKFCSHPPFDGIDYCWGLAVAADANKVKEFIKNSCPGCEFKRKKP